MPSCNRAKIAKFPNHIYVCIYNIHKKCMCIYIIHFQEHMELTNIHHILNHKTIHNKSKKLQVIEGMLFDFSRRKLENSKKNSLKSSQIFRNKITNF